MDNLSTSIDKFMNGAVKVFLIVTVGGFLIFLCIGMLSSIFETETTPTPTSTPRPSGKPELIAQFESCNTSFDVANLLGEVTNAYVLVGNIGKGVATNLKFTLAANDEDDRHPDKEYNLDELLPKHGVKVKLTVDTAQNVDTALTLTVVTGEGIKKTVKEPSCKDIDPDLIFNTIDLLSDIKDLAE